MKTKMLHLLLGLLVFGTWHTMTGTNDTGSTYNYVAYLSGTQETPAVLTTGYGSISANLTGTTLTITGAFQGLSSDFDANVAGGAHIHLGLAGRNGGIELLLNTTVAADLRSGTYEAPNNTFTLTDDQINALMARELYINIHTVGYPGGELRGQLLPEVDAHYQANLLGSNQVPSINTVGGGNLQFELWGNDLTISGSFDDLEGAILYDLANGAHIHVGHAGRNGDVAFPLNLTPDADDLGSLVEAANNTFTLDANQLALLQEEGLYINIHTEAFNPGELRGQILPMASAVFRAELTGVQQVPAIDTEASGRLYFTHDGMGNLSIGGTFNNLSSDLNTDLAGGIHVHLGYAGQNGDIELILTPELAADNRNAIIKPADNSFALSAAQLDALFARQLYVNIHSLTFIPGELRGQILPLASTYLGLNMAGENQVPAILTPAVGDLQLELTNDNLIVTGGFSGLIGDYDANIGGGAHLHIADAAGNGDIGIFLNTTVGADLKSGTYEAGQNTFTIDDTQKNALLSGEFYVNIHTTEFPSGELRGQVLRDDNKFPWGDFEITDPTNNSSVQINDDPSVSYNVVWDPTVDPDNDLVVYTFQLAMDSDFQELRLNEKVGIDPMFGTTNDVMDAILESDGIAIGESATYYQRVLGSDGSVSNPSASQTITFERVDILSITDPSLAQAIALIPNPAKDFAQIISTNHVGSSLSVAIYNTTGSLVMQPQPYGSSDRIDISKLPNGIYFVHITDSANDLHLVKRLIKE
ncbi:MAG: CHRD domain-containing protein [Flavobacteriaceae bacterium]|nr:CHRD domain-containing protein [Flavobacteriaceae bacterium]